MHTLPNAYPGISNQGCLQTCCEEDLPVPRSGFFGRALARVGAGVSNLGVLLNNGLQRAVQSVKTLCSCLGHYFRLHRPDSQESRQYAAHLDTEMRAQGFTPQAPAQVTMVAHSGGAATAISLASQTGRAFQVRDIVTFGSPVTPELLRRIPANVRLRYVTSHGDVAQSALNTASDCLCQLTGQEVIATRPQAHHPNVETVQLAQPVGHSEYGQLPPQTVSHLVQGTAR